MLACQMLPWTAGRHNQAGGKGVWWLPEPSFHLAFLCCIYIQSTPANSTNIMIRPTAWLEAYVAVHAGPSNLPLSSACKLL